MLTWQLKAFVFHNFVGPQGKWMCFWRKVSILLTNQIKIIRLSLCNEFRSSPSSFSSWFERNGKCQTICLCFRWKFIRSPKTCVFSPQQWQTKVIFMDGADMPKPWFVCLYRMNSWSIHFLILLILSDLFSKSMARGRFTSAAGLLWSSSELLTAVFAVVRLLSVAELFFSRLHRQNALDGNLFEESVWDGGVRFKQEQDSQDERLCSTYIFSN